MNMVDRIATALSSIGADGCETVLEGGSVKACIGPCRCRDFARAAIASMREPTPAMVDAGYFRFDDEQVQRPREPMNAWPAMIDAALEGK